MATISKGNLRRCLFWTGGIVLVLVLGAGAALGCVFIGAADSNVGDLAFDQPLAIPPLLDPELDADGRKVFDLEFTAGETELIPGVRTPTWGLNQTYLSPTLRASQGDTVVVNVRNGVNEPTTLHWHGMHLPAAMDGGPHQIIEPGETWSPTWTINQPAATLWFHPHPHYFTAEHVYRGAAGMFIVDDPESGALELPHEYGVDDIPLVIQDKRLISDGSLDLREPMFGELGVLGDEILVNGTHAPYLEATTSLVRFRVLNASNGRVYNLGFSDDREFALIATDTGLLEAPVTLDRMQLSPGERVELVVEVSASDEVMLRSFAPDLQLDPWTARMNGGHDVFDILQIRAAPNLITSPPLPDTLVTVDRPAEASSTRTRSFALEGHSRINGLEMDMGRIDAVVEAGSTEIWEVRNASGVIHNFHVHLVHFIVLDIDGEAPPPHLQGWKDTIFIPRGSTVRFIARFDVEPDPTVPFMFHCHILMHEDQGMMGQFVVVEPSTAHSVNPISPGEHRH